jgi:hypothetical protein
MLRVARTATPMRSDLIQRNADKRNPGFLTTV